MKILEFIGNIGIIWKNFKADFTRSSRIKDSSDPSRFIFEINVGKSRIRHATTL